LFESLGFESDAAQQIATNMALFKLPRKGMDSSINYFDQLQFQLNKEKSEEEKEEDIDSQFDLPTPNIPAATTTTNIYEEKKIKENFNDNNIYDGTTAAMKNLDWERPVSPKTGSFSTEAQEEFDLHNDNINRALKEVPPGNSREGGMANNKSKNF
jgi:hypothetical protein